MAMHTEENQEAAPPLEPPKTWLDRGQALFEVVLLAGVISSLMAAVPFSIGSSGRTSLLQDIHLMSAYVLLEAFITLVFLFLIMRAHGETLEWLGLSWKRWRSDILAGLAVIPLLLILNLVVSAVFQVLFPKYFLERNPLTELIRTPQDLVLFIVTALIAGGIKEEMQRAFILRRFQAYLGGAKIGLIIWSIVFALGHFVQGAQGMVAAGIFGLIFGIVYLTRGNLVAPMVAHGVYDTVALLGSWFLVSHH